MNLSITRRSPVSPVSALRMTSALARSAAGLGGHLAIRLISRRFGDRMPESLSALTQAGQELLALGLGFSLLLSIRP